MGMIALLAEEASKKNVGVAVLLGGGVFLTLALLLFLVTRLDEDR